MDDQTVSDQPWVALTPEALRKLDAIAEVTLNSQLDVLVYAIELARKKLPPTPKPAGAKTRSKAAS